jgi:predicted DNA-binding transcriptional regulator YafY
VAQGKRLQLRYFTRSSAEHSEREVSPQRLVYYRDNWYLDAWCHLREGLRTFALDAVAEAREMDMQALEVSQPDLDVHHASSYGIFSGPPKHLAVLRFGAHRARWVAKERWHRDQEGRFLDDGRYELSVPYSNALELIMDVLKYGSDVEVLEPRELREAVAERLRAALAVYAPDEGGEAADE